MKAFKLKPACKDYIWGGQRLKTEYNIKSNLNPLAEAWVLSCHPDGPSLLDDGTTLPQYLSDSQGALGEKAKQFENFPLMIKLIDAKDNLSIQVHPSDSYALRHEHQYGKTEMWVVLDAEPNAFLYYGFKHEITKEEFLKRIEQNTLTELLNAVPVHKGDVFFIPAGTLHAICKGIVIAEIQQNSNVTYRIYDYGRVGADGKPRQLHIKEALEVTSLCPPQVQNFAPHLGQCKYFTADLKTAPYEGAADASSFTALLVIEGEGTLFQDGEAMQISAGNCIFIPASSGKYSVNGSCKIISVQI